MERAMDKPIVFCDIDGCVADFVKGYREAFNRDAYADDAFTVKQFCLQSPHFFRDLPVIPKGRELVEILSDDYTVVFLTTPMDEMEYCRRDKLEWIKEKFGTGFDVIFSHDKASFVEDEKSILIDDMDYNLKPWADAGGSAIDFNRNRVDAIIEKIEEAIYGKKEVEKLTDKLKKIVVNPEPSEKQKEQGNYAKGEIVFKGIPIMIENTPGSIRFGFDERGRKWVSRMKAHYGYVKRTEGADGDEIDVFIGPKLNASRAFVINQNKPDGSFDEVKIILGCEDRDEAVNLYLAHYQKGWEQNIGIISQTNTKKLREWLAGKTRFEPFPDNEKK
jgi:5'(3')-deoxyribonucleotidase